MSNHNTFQEEFIEKMEQTLEYTGGVFSCGFTPMLGMALLVGENLRFSGWKRTLFGASMIPLPIVSLAVTPVTLVISIVTAAGVWVGGTTYSLYRGVIASHT